MAITRLSGGNTPPDGSDPRTFPAIWNDAVDDIEALELPITADRIADGAVTAPKLAKTAGAVMVFDDATARTTAIPTPVEGMVTYLKDTDAVEKYDGDDFVGVATPPAILQVVQDIKTDSFSASLAAGTFSSEVTGLSATITPSATSSKVLVTVALGGVFNTSGIKLLINGSDSTYIGDVSGSRGRASSTASFGGSSSLVFLHSPSSVSAQTYTIKIQNTESGTQTVFLNTSSFDQLRAPTTASSITLMEVAG